MRRVLILGHNQILFGLLLLFGLNLPACALQPGDQAPVIALPRMDNGETLYLSDMTGKVVYVDFWASWCGPCRQSLPLYEALKNRLAEDRFKIIAINLDEKREDAERFLNRHPVSYQVLLDPAGNSARDWAVPAMPSSYLVDSNGILASIYIGFQPSHIGTIEHDIKKILENTATTQPD
jgi:cytochrome c biogenesis protein CcmG/thiol:disulfide interchange protein DsbE